MAIFPPLQSWSCVMGIAWTPPIVPKGDDENVYLLVDNLGSYGEVWREIETVRTDLECVITDLLDEQYNSPVTVVGFNTAEGWSRDVSAGRRVVPSLLSSVAGATGKHPRICPAARTSRRSQPVTACLKSCLRACCTRN